MDGCFAERFSIPASCLVPVPDPIDDDHAVFTEPLAGAVHASRIVHLEGKGFVTVLGDTLSAMLCAQVMEPLNNTVRLLGRRPERFTLAEKWGVRHRHVDEVGLRADQDVVIVCTGRAADFALAARMVRPRGKIVLKTEPMPVPGAPGPGGRPDASDGAGVDLTPIIENEIEIHGARCGSAGDALGVLSAGGVDLTGLITRRFKFDDAIAALRAATEPEQIQVVLDC
jgi:alcohol dehydrogenase